MKDFLKKYGEDMSTLESQNLPDIYKDDLNKLTEQWRVESERVSFTVEDCILRAQNMAYGAGFRRRSERVVELEKILELALTELVSFKDDYTGKFADERLRELMTPNGKGEQPAANEPNEG